MNRINRLLSGQIEKRAFDAGKVILMKLNRVMIAAPKSGSGKPPLHVHCYRH